MHKKDVPNATKAAKLDNTSYFNLHRNSIEQKNTSSTDNSSPTNPEHNLQSNSDEAKQQLEEISKKIIDVKDVKIKINKQSELKKTISALSEVSSQYLGVG